MDAKFSEQVQEVLRYSREEALRLGHNYIGIEHFLLGILREEDCTATKVLKSLGVDLSFLRKSVEASVRNAGSYGSSTVTSSGISLVKQAERVLKLSYIEAKSHKKTMVNTEHLLLTILKDSDNVVTRALEPMGVDYNAVNRELGEGE